MAFGIEILEKYISTCVSCVNNRDGLCGFINDGSRNEEPEHISLGEYEMMTSEELDLLNTRNQGVPCSQQLSEDQLLDKLENILEGYDITPAETEVKKIITQCYKLVNKARRNDGSLDGDFDRAVEQGVNVILSYLDLRSLEGGKDISDLLAMYPFGYYRKTGLYRYCPEELAALYLSEIQQSKDKASGIVEAPEPQLPVFLDNDTSDMSFSEFNKLDIHEKFSVVIDKTVCNLKKIIQILSDESQSDYIDELHSLDTLVSKTQSHSPQLVQKSDAPEYNFFKGEFKFLHFLKERQSPKSNTNPLEEYKNLYGQNQCSKYLSGVLARCGIVSPTMFFIDNTSVKIYRTKS